MAQGLKVPLVVEKRPITFVRDDVIDVGRHHDLSMLEALFAVRMLGDEAITQLLPAVRVAALVRVARLLHSAQLSLLGSARLRFSVAFLAGVLVALTVALTTRHWAVAPRIRTDSQQWHRNLAT